MIRLYKYIIEMNEFKLKTEAKNKRHYPIQQIQGIYGYINSYQGMK